MLTKVLGDDTYTRSGDALRGDECSSSLVGPGLHAFIGRSHFGPLLMILKVGRYEIRTVYNPPSSEPERRMSSNMWLFGLDDNWIVHIQFIFSNQEINQFITFFGQH